MIPGLPRSLCRAVPAALLLGIVLSAAPAAAHPHAYIEYAATLRFDDGQRIAALEVSWIFDEMYSAYAVDGLDADRNGRIDPAELAPLASENLAMLAEWGYFTYLKLDGRRIVLGPPGPHASLFQDGRIAMRFSLPLAEPVDPRRGRVAFAGFDPTFYIDMTPLPGTPFTFAGTAPPDCRIELGPDPATGDRFVPDATANELDQGPGGDVEASLGARFARWAVVACGTAP